MAFDIPFNLLVLFIGMSMTIGLLGIYLGLRKIAGAPFLTVFAGIMMFAIFVMTNNVSIGHTEAIEYTVTHPMNVTTSTTSEAFSSTITAQAERPINVLSVLVNKQISCIEINMLRTGSPTDNVMIGIGDNDARMIKLFGNITASTINTGTRSYQVCLPNHDYWTLAYNDYIMIKHTGSAPSNFISISSDAGNPFDSNNSGKSKYTSGTWSDTAGHDLRMKLTSDNANIIDNPINYQFGLTSSPAPELTAYLIVFAVLFVFLGVMIQIQKWS